MLVSLRRALSVLAAACISFLPPLVAAQSVLQPIPTSPSGTARAAAVNPVTNRIYVLNEFDNTVSVVDGKTRGILATVAVGTRPEYIAVNPYTNRIYVSQGDASLSVINGADNTVATYPVGATGPVVADPYTGLIYNVRLSTAATDEVTIFDDRGATPTWHSVSTQSFEPVDITLDPLRHWYYVVHYPAGHVRQIDATSTADTPPSTQIDVGKPADLIAGNPITNFWYVLTENTATPIAWVDGSNDTPGGFAPTNGGTTGPAALAVNTVTNKTYAAFSTGVFVIDGISTNPAFIASGSSAGGPAAIGINKTTNKVYVANGDGTLTIIDGDTNAASTVAIPAGANSVAVNPITNRIYVTTSAGLTEIDGAATDTPHANPLQTTIAPFASNSSTADATFTFNASTSFAPASMPIQRVYYQVDATDGPWQRATGSGPYTGTATGLAAGSHTVYAFAVDGQDAPLTGKVADPLVGSMASYTFHVGGGTASSISLITSKNPALAGDSITFTASVTGSAGAPTGSVDFVDGTTVISGCGGVAVASGTAACTTSTLAIGTHSITARYSGDATYAPSTSAAISETVNPQRGDVTLSLTSAPNPSTSGQSVTFNVTLSGASGAVTGTVTFNDGSSAIAGCSAVAINAGAASCATSALAVGSHTVTAAYSGSSSYNAGTSAPVSQVVNASLPNVALASAGAVATASSQLNANFPVAAVIDGDELGTNWSAGGGWADGTLNQYPDWVQVQFASAKQIQKVVVFTLQDNWQSPSQPTDTMTFSQYGITDFTVQGWDGTTWQTLATVTGNNLVKRTLTFAPFNTDRIRIHVTNALASLSRIVEIEAYGSAGTPVPPPTSTDVALASNGGTATASSTYGAGFPVSAVINGDRKGSNWGAGGGWADATVDTYPDWVQVDFSAAQTIDHVTVYTLQDNWQSPVEPTDTMTFTQYGVTDYQVQGWNGSQWVTLGSVSGNNLVKSTVWFDPFSTSRIRVNVTNALASLSRITEIEAWSTSAVTPPPPQQTNVALASTGAVASASSTFSSDYPVSAINNNERAGAGWSMGGGWADGTVNQFPDWVQIDFNGPQTIDHVVVYTLQDNWQNPVEPTDTMTFTQYGVTDFTVQAWDGSQWLTVGTVSGNNLVKRTVSFTAVTATKIRINVINALSSLSRITEVEAWGVRASNVSTQTNWALASSGAHATGSSEYGSGFPASAAINGDRAGTNWSAGGGWADGTPDQYPDTLEVDFAAAKSIDHVIVYTVQDNWQAPVEPTDSMTFTQYGVTDFDVQGWNGSQWVTLGSVTGNNFVKRTVPFAAFTTDRIRIVVNHSLASLSRITEVEAWGN